MSRRHQRIVGIYEIRCAANGVAEGEARRIAAVRAAKAQRLGAQ